MSFQSAVNVLHSVEVFAEIKKKNPLLAAQHKKAQLAGAKKHQYWIIHDWRRIIFPDEAKINTLPQKIVHFEPPSTHFVLNLLRIISNQYSA
ncbi:hypothetical protein G6F43_011659 [Rhizopus delemar]|nr:hypothetical protein G6F43_011659 [Rhizopus delemar]